jgi:hypothetical protein
MLYLSQSEGSSINETTSFLSELLYLNSTLLYIISNDKQHYGVNYEIGFSLDCPFR